MIAILKYNAGNTLSVQNALNRLGYESIITDNEEAIRSAEKVIFPGVGEASTAMQYLKHKKLDKLIPTLTQPFLGICLGLQIMCKNSEEGNTDCLGIFNAEVKQFSPQQKVPHMGWNNFETINGELLKTINASDNVYYVHSYFAEVCEHTIATCNYITTFSAVMQHNNFYATQFHPEKSASIGEQILKNFLQL